MNLLVSFFNIEYVGKMYVACCVGSITYYIESKI